MKYRVETTPRFEKEFRKLDRYTQRMLKAWIDKNLVDCADPRAHGKGLTATGADSGGIALEITVCSASLRMKSW